MTKTLLADDWDLKQRQEKKQLEEVFASLMKEVRKKCIGTRDMQMQAWCARRRALGIHHTWVGVSLVDLRALT